jgi:hypothetical protein
MGRERRVGLGLERAKASLVAAGYAEPSISDSANSVVATFAGWSAAGRRLTFVQRLREVPLLAGGHLRQIRSLEHLLAHDVLTNADYRHLTGVSDVTSLQDLGTWSDAGSLLGAAPLAARTTRYRTCCPEKTEAVAAADCSAGQ